MYAHCTHVVKSKIVSKRNFISTQEPSKPIIKINLDSEPLKIFENVQAN